MGPPLGFPGDLLRLAPVGDPSRAAACFANKVFTADPSRTLPAAVDSLWRPSARRTENSAADGGGVSIGEPGNAGVSGGRHGGGNSEIGPGSRRRQAAAGAVVIPKVFALSVRDVRVEFPYQASLCPGDMEHGEVIRWLRRFRNTARGGDEAATSVSFQGAVGDVVTEISAGEVAEDTDGRRVEVPSRSGGGAGKLRDNANQPRHPHGRSASAPAIAREQTTSRHRPPTNHVPWACQYVEAREFDLCVVVSGGVSSGGCGGSSSGVLPNLNCAISGVSVSTADYTKSVTGYCDRSRTSSYDLEKTNMAESSSMAASNVPPPSGVQKAEKIDGVGGKAAGGGGRGGGGNLFSGHGGSRGLLSRGISVSLGGTRHAPSSRRR